MDNYAKYLATCERIREENETLLNEFGEWLEQKNLSQKTIRRHTLNAKFYVNEFLLYEDPIKAKNGAVYIGMFLGYWFIRKAMWASPAQIKSNAASLKKFYTFMQEKGAIKQKELDFLKERVKKEMPEWIARMKRYDDPNIESMAQVWGRDY